MEPAAPAQELVARELLPAGDDQDGAGLGAGGDQQLREAEQQLPADISPYSPISQLQS